MQQFKEFLGEAYTIRPKNVKELAKLNNFDRDQKVAILDLWKFVGTKTDLDSPLIFDDKSSKVVKIHDDAGLNDDEETLSKIEGLKGTLNVKFGTGSAPKTDQYYIPPGQTATKFYEQWSSIGLIQTEYNSSTIGSWMKELPDIGTNDSDVAKNIVKLYSNYYGKVQGQKDFTDKIPGHYPTIVSILLGSANFKKDYSTFFSRGGISILNGSIDSYYKVLKTNYKNQVDFEDKENTADAVIFNGGLTLDKLTGGEVTFDDDGVITFEDGQAIQVSMKKGKEAARIGKIKDLLTAWGVWSPDKKTSKLNKYYGDLSAEMQLDGMILDEGILDLIKSGARYAKEGLSKLASSISSAFSIISRGVISIVKRFNFRRETDKLLLKYSKYITEKKISQEDQLRALTTNRGAIDALNEDLRKGVLEVSNKIETINGKVDGIVALQYQEAQKERLPYNATYDDVRMVFFNILSFDILSDILDKISSSESSYNEALQRFVGMYRSSVMGNTKLPVIKVFGVRTASDTSYEVYKSADFDVKRAEVSTKIKEKNMSLGGLKLNVQGYYYVIYFYVAGELKGEGVNAKLTYNNVRPTAYGGTQFKVEIDSTVDESVFKTQFCL